MRTCRVLIVAGIAALVAAGASCGFDTSGLGALPADDVRDAPLADADLDAGVVDATAPDARPVDAKPAKVDARPPCGAEGQACCDDDDAPCNGNTECDDGTCTACGGAFESCCDPGATCRGLAVCVNGGCV
jgi:hypothetical protein